MEAVLSMAAMVALTVGMVAGRRRAHFHNVPVAVLAVARGGRGVALNEQVTVYAACSLTVAVSQETVQ
jgi:hypothetical protein